MPDTAASPAFASACYLHNAAAGPEFQSIQLSLNIGEACQVEHLHHAWQQVYATHGILRSGFIRGATGETIRREIEAGELPLTVLDWKEIAPAEIPSRWSDLLKEDSLQPFDLASPPLIRFKVIELPGGSKHQLVSFSKLLLDEDALFHVLCEWLEALGGRAPQPAGEIPPAGTSSPAIADWWSRFFSRAPETAPFLIYPKPAASTENLRQENTFSVDRETSREITAFCQRAGISPRDFFLAVWSLLLSRLTSRETSLLLAPAPRENPENILPANPPIDYSAKVEAWLRDVAQSEKDRVDNASISLERTLLLAQPSRRLSDFSASYLWLPPAINDRIHDVFPRWINFDAKVITHSQFSLSLQVRDGNRFALQIESDPSACPPTEAAALLDRVIATVEKIIADPARKVGSLSVLTEAETSTLTPAKAIAVKVPEKSIEQQIAAIAESQPDTLAITGPNDAALSYAELDSHARSLATWLRNENLADGWNIAVCLTPTPWLPVAVLGILRAGNTCVPLDSQSAAPWLNARVDNSDVEMIVCDSNTSTFFEGTSRRLLVLDQQWEAVSASTGGADCKPPKNAFLLNGTQSDEPPALRSLTPDFVAAACQESISLWSLQAQDRVALLAAPGTGAFVETLLSALIAGATLVLPEDGDALSLAETGAITHLRLSSAQWRVLASRLVRKEVPLPESLRTICVETDSAVLASDIAWRLLTGSEVKAILFYSPAGLSGASVRLEISDEDKPAFISSDIPIGFAGPGVKASLLDPAGQILPPHYPGRLELSFSQKGSEKFTLPAWRDKAGAIHFVPSETSVVEQLLRQQPGVLDACCATVEVNSRSVPGSWIVAQDSSIQPAQAALQQLPKYLCPEFTMAVSDLPLTPAGNIDKAKLPVPTAPPAPAPRPEKPTATATPTARPAAHTPPPAQTQDWEPFVLFHKTPDAPSLFLVHDVGGDPSKYATLAGLLQKDWTVYGTTARGLHNPSACHLTVETEAAALVESICLLDPDGPFHLFGFGFGAVLAMEMARQLRVAGRQVPYLALTGSRPPENSAEPNWKKTFSKVFSFGGAKTPAPTHPSTPAAAAHLSALQSYHGRPLSGPAGIILGNDMGRDVEAAWTAAVPEAIIEQMKCPTAQMLTEPPVKRLAVILGEWADPSGED